MIVKPIHNLSANLTLDDNDLVHSSFILFFAEFSSCVLAWGNRDSAPLHPYNGCSHYDVSHLETTVVATDCLLAVEQLERRRSWTQDHFDSL